MPGKKDFVSTTVEVKHVHIQKRLVLNNLREVYHEFKEKFPARKVGFSKFAELWPKHCVLAGASGTRSVCVHNTSKCKIDDVHVCNAASKSPLLSNDHMQSTTA